MFSLNNLTITRKQGQDGLRIVRHLEKKRTAGVNISAKPLLRQRNDSACDSKREKKSEREDFEGGHSVLLR